MSQAFRAIDPFPRSTTAHIMENHITRFTTTRRRRSSRLRSLSSKHRLALVQRTEIHRVPRVTRQRSRGWKTRSKKLLKNPRGRLRSAIIFGIRNGGNRSELPCACHVGFQRKHKLKRRQRRSGTTTTRRSIYEDAEGSLDMI